MEPYVIAAIITCGTTLVTTVVNLHYAKEGKKREEKIQNTLQLGKQHFDERMVSLNAENMRSLEKTRIEASVKAKSRIEWIQNVRKDVSILMGLYDSILSSYDDFIMMKQLRLKMIEQTNLVILYFGNDREYSKNRPDLLCTDTNKGKNDLIVSLLLRIEQCINVYCEKTTEEEYKKLKEQYDKVLSQYQEHIIGIDYEDDIVIDGEAHHATEYLVDEEYDNMLSEKKNELDSTLKSLIKLNTDLRKDICTFRDVIRLYLKIEWDIAKEGV